MTLTEKELNTVWQAFTDVMMRFTDDELHKFMGSMTIDEMKELWGKLRYREYCEKHGITYEQMTEDDFEREYQEHYGA